MAEMRTGAAAMSRQEATGTATMRCPRLRRRCSMAIRLNYTGRKKLNREDARFRLQSGGLPGGPCGDGLTFDAQLKLDGYDIAEPDARVWVEAYHRTMLMRFDFGRIGLIVKPAERRLSLFPDPNAVLFRVKVTSEAGADR